MAADERASMKLTHKSHLLFHTVRYLTLKQIVYRARAMVRRRWWLIRKQKAAQGCDCQVRDFGILYEGVRDSSPNDLRGVLATAVQRAIDTSQGRFSFLNQVVQYENGFKWHDSQVSQLWRYHLHYFDYVEDLIIWSSNENSEKAWLTFKALSSSWISDNAFLKGDGWHPYTVSLRIVNWLNGFGYWRTYFDEEPVFREVFLSSLYGQARFLAANLEHDVRGNHLLKNIKALLWSGTAFFGKEPLEWCHKAVRLLEQELAEQVLSDGGHFERAPGYHGVVLKDCLEMGLWLKRNGRPVSAWLDAAVLRMLRYLKTILPPDGQLPLLKDTAWDTGPVPLDLLSSGALYLNRPEFKLTEDFGLFPWLLFGHGGRKEFQDLGLSMEPKESKPLVDSGFFVLRDNKRKDYLIFDAGKPCPEYLPAHAHADMFSYELMVGGQRVVVDSGIYEYTSGKWRDFFRSTKAHNSVEIDGKNQSEIWGSFRVARRARPGPVYYRASENHVVIDARHNGYRRQGIQALHRRVLCWEKGRFWLVFDEIYGKGHIRAKSFVHLHPSLCFNPTSTQMFHIHGVLESPMKIQRFGVEENEIIKGREKSEIQGWYSEEFGKKVPNEVLSLEKEGQLPFGFGYVLYPDEDIEIQFSQMGNRLYDFRLIMPDRTVSIHIQPGKVTYLS